MGKPEVLYKFENVTKVFGNKYVLNDISFDIKQGEIFGVIGQSGSGKSTLLNLLIGFYQAERGQVLLKDLHLVSAAQATYRDSYKDQKTLKYTYGFAAQSPSFYPNLTVIENLKYFGTLYNLPHNSLVANAENLLEMVGLKQSQHVLASKLSGGMTKRLDIACSLIHDPKILILDEPTADLDPTLAMQIWEILEEINGKGTTIIIASHQLTDLEHHCDRLVLIKDGKVAAIGRPSEIKGRKSLRKGLQEVFIALTSGKKGKKRKK